MIHVPLVQMVKFNIETNTVVESCDVTFNKSAHVLVMSLNVQVKKIEYNIFIDEEL
jgi:hypothetical protein